MFAEERWCEESGPGGRELHATLFGPPPPTGRGSRRAHSGRKRVAQEKDAGQCGETDTPSLAHVDTPAPAHAPASKRRKRGKRRVSHEEPAAEIDREECHGDTGRTFSESRPSSEGVVSSGVTAGVRKKRKTNKMKKAEVASKKDGDKSRVRDVSLSCTLTPSAGDRKKSNPFHKKMATKMEGARFRWINEQLYTSTSKQAKHMFTDDPKLFEIYHRGFKTQVAKWPEDPLDRIIADIESLPADTTVADMGCGEARLSRSVPHRVHSFDLVALNEAVTVCDMARVPLPEASVDMCVFCLSLMGTNVGDFVREAHRILRHGGTLRVAEIESRISSLDGFVADIEALGFVLLHMRRFSKMFVHVAFQAVEVTQRPNSDLHLKPCTYKKR